MKTITKYILASSFVAILTLTLFGGYSVKQYQEHEAREEHKKLEMCIRTFRELLSNKGDDFRTADRQLFVGTFPVNGNFEVVDKIQELFGGVATIFMGDVRVSTNVLNAAGERALGTRLVGPAYDAIFKHGTPYRGKAKILGEPYLTAYDPIKNRQGEIIGVLFVGVKESEFLAPLKVLEMHLALIMFGMVITLILFMVVLGRESLKSEKKNENQLRLLQTLIDTIPNPIYYKDTQGFYLGCNTSFEAIVGKSKSELFGKTAHEIWPKELADSFHLKDQELLEHPGLQIYDGAVRNVDGKQCEVIFNKATFHNEEGSLQGLVGIMLDVTERKQAEAAVAFQNILLSTQQEASIDGILVVDEGGKILSFNRRFVEIMGIPPQLLETNDDGPVLEYVTGQVVDPEGFLEKVKYLYSQQHESCRDEMLLRCGKTLDRYTVPLLGPDGRYFGRLWSFRDITERKAAEEETRNAYQQLLDIVEFLPDATFVVDKHKRVIAWNRAIEKMTGFQKEDVIGQGDYIYAIPFYGERRPILIDLIDEDIDVIKRNYSHINVEGRTLFAETHLPTLRDSGDSYLWATATPLFNAQGNQVGGIESIRDITEYKQAEEEKIRLESQLDHARLMETVISRLGHDLKTPLTPLFIMLPLLRKQLTDDKQINKVDVCIKSAATINNLADKAKMLATLSSGIKPHEMEDVVLALMADQAVADHAGMISQKRLNCQNTIDLSVVVKAVSAQFRELFSNLVSNAVHFSSENGSVDISAERHDESVMVSIRDEGMGIDPAVLDHIFEEFFKADESRHDLNASGLGLSICKRIVQNHHGRIWAESAGIGHGTTVKFVINSL